MTKEHRSISKAPLIELLADVLFAYVNKDEDMPHDFEYDAIIPACEVLIKEYEGSVYTNDFFEVVLKDMQEVRDKILS